MHLMGSNSSAEMGFLLSVYCTVHLPFNVRLLLDDLVLYHFFFPGTQLHIFESQNEPLPKSLLLPLVFNVLPVLVYESNQSTLEIPLRDLDLLHRVLGYLQGDAAALHNIYYYLHPLSTYGLDEEIPAVGNQQG